MMLLNGGLPHFDNILFSERPLKEAIIKDLFTNDIEQQGNL